eukprot:5300124-Pleurochrysis_carterae.AAC.3
MPSCCPAFRCSKHCILFKAASMCLHMNLKVWIVHAASRFRRPRYECLCTMVRAREYTSACSSACEARFRDRRASDDRRSLHLHSQQFKTALTTKQGMRNKISIG